MPWPRNTREYLNQMSTAKQLEANRLNSLKSTGPKTLEGKAASSANAIKWGLFTKRVLLNDDDAEEFARLSQAIE